LDGPEEGLPLGPAERIGDRRPRLAEQRGGQAGRQVGVMPDGAREIPAMGELLGRAVRQERGAGKLAERQRHDPLKSAVGREGRDRELDALLVGGDEVPARVVRVGRRVLPGNGDGPPARRPDEVVDQRPDVPRRARCRRVQLIRFHLRQDSQRALESLVQFRHLRSSRLSFQLLPWRPRDTRNRIGPGAVWHHYLVLRIGYRKIWRCAGLAAAVSGLGCGLLAAGPAAFAADPRGTYHGHHPHPVRWTIAIPAIGVVAPVIELGGQRSGRITVPGFAQVWDVGWYRYGAVPGSPGNAVLLGHVDTYSGPAIFYN